MSTVVSSPPFSPVEPVVDVLHGVPVADPYRWLEFQNSPETRAWIEAQRTYASAYLCEIPGRKHVHERARQLLDVETFDSFLQCGSRYFFRKRSSGDEQPSICLREGAEGQDQILVDPAKRGTGNYTAVRPLQTTRDGTLLLYEVKHGGERMGRFEILDVANRRVLPDTLPHSFLRGFAFSPDAKGFYYAHEAAESARPFLRAAYYHAFGTTSASDRQIFVAGEDERLRLHIVAGRHQLGFLVYRFLERTTIDFHLWPMGSSGSPLAVLRDAEHSFAPRFLPGRILAAVDCNAPNGRIVDVQARRNHNPLFFDLVPEGDAPIRDWLLTRNRTLVTYAQGTGSRIEVFDFFGQRAGQVPDTTDRTVRIVAAHPEEEEIFLERESFTQPIEIHRFSPVSGTSALWTLRKVPFDPTAYLHSRTTFSSKDGTNVPIFLFGRREAMGGGIHSAVMTSYGGYGISVTPQFSVLVTLLVERGCLFALPAIRGGSEFGADWHNAAKRRKRQVAFDDFLFAARWLIETGRTVPEKLAIFGGSNSGLLVAVAMTQRPDLFRAVLCLVPLTDMLRFHHFDGAHVWKDEFGTVEDREDFEALARYSPYHAVRDGTAYPATLLVSGDADQNCNSLHARKFTARLQAATGSDRPVLLAYHPLRGHAPVLPLTERIEALTDRVSFLCHWLGVPFGGQP